MICPIKRHTIVFLHVTFMLSGVHVKAQDSLLRTTIEKIERLKYYSYQSIERQKQLFANDTTIQQRRASFEKTPNTFLFKIEMADYTDIYDGQNLLHIIPKDSTYEIKKIGPSVSQRELPGLLQWLQGRLEKKSTNIEKAADTAVYSVDNYHLLVTVYDTIIDKQRNFTTVDVFIEKASGMPDLIVVRSSNTTYGSGVSTYYSENRYFNYSFDQHDLDTAITKGFHMINAQPPVASERPALLPIGSMAPNWALYTSEGKRISLAEMKGKVVLLDFYFIGCFPCMQTLKPLNKIFDKYKNKPLVIASLTERDSAKTVMAFEKNYHIDYPGFVGAADVVKSYHVSGFPTFYFIDKEGKIANVFLGAADNFEEKVTSILDNLINK
jgi:peroxiredoxin